MVVLLVGVSGIVPTIVRRSRSDHESLLSSSHQMGTVVLGFSPSTFTVDRSSLPSLYRSIRFLLALRHTLDHVKAEVGEDLPMRSPGPQRHMVRAKHKGEAPTVAHPCSVCPAHVVPGAGATECSTPGRGAVAVHLISNSNRGNK